MTYQELVTEIKQLPLSEQLSLLNMLTRLVSVRIDHLEQTESSVARVRGMLKPEHSLPDEADLANDYTDYLIKKYS